MEQEESRSLEFCWDVTPTIVAELLIHSQTS